MEKRLKFGRRKSDWLIPAAFLLLAFLAALWAILNLVGREKAEDINSGLQSQVKLQERLIKHYENTAAKKVEKKAEKTR